MESVTILPLWATLDILNSFSFDIGISLIIMIILLLLSALMSGSEVAYFSIGVVDQERLKKEDTLAGNRILKLLEQPKKLLATILIANNFINVVIVAVSTYVTKLWVSNDINPTYSFLIQVVLITFLILLFGEVMPKVYATKYNISLAKFMAPTFTILKALFSPLSYLLVSSTSFIDKKIKRRTDSISVDYLEHALNMTRDVGENAEEKKILEGIIKFGNTDAKQIMTPRMDVAAFDISISYQELRANILESKFSRLPIYQDTLDNVKGIIYVKDLLPHIDEEHFEWQTLLHAPKFIPENKKLDDLLTEFQTAKRHLAIVVDEYGGTSGIVTLEDVLEEIVGDITDEFDDEDIVYSQIDEFNFVFEGKTPLMDLYRITGLEGEEFEEEKGEADTIAGFCIEQAGKILLKNEKVNFNDVIFTVEAADKRKIKQIKVTLPQRNSNNQEN